MANQPAAVIEQMKRNGWWNEPELSDEAREAFRWWCKIEKWRPFKQQEDGSMIPYRLEFSDLLDFRNVYDTALDNEYLFEVVRAIDDEWIMQLSKKSRQVTQKHRRNQSAR